MLRIGYDAKRIFHNRTGLGNYGRDLVRILSENFPENRYLLYNPKPSREILFRLGSSMTERRPASWWHKKFPAWWRSKGIIADLLKDGVDVYHGLSAELPVGISRTGISSILTVHDLIFIRYPHLYKAFDRWIYRKKLEKALAEAHQIVAISEQTKRDLISLAGADAERIKVIYQGCHPVFKREIPEESLEAFRKAHDLPPKFLLQVGTIEPRKNALTTVRALKDLPYHLVLVGRPTPYAGQIRDFVRTHGMEDRIRIMSHVPLDELAKWYRLAHVSVYPSIFEGFGIPIIESLYAGTPVITNSRGVFPEAAGPGGIYLDDVTDVDEMREKIRWSMENDLSVQAQKAREYVHRFDDDVLAGQWMDLYRALARKS